MSYDMIDRFLRNNLDDDSYAEYSVALDELCAPPPQRKPLTFEQRMRIHNECCDSISLAIALTEAAHGIKGDA